MGYGIGREQTFLPLGVSDADAMCVHAEIKGALQSWRYESVIRLISF